MNWATPTQSPPRDWTSSQASPLTIRLIDWGIIEECFHPDNRYLGFFYSLFPLGLSQIWCRSSCLQYHEQGKYRLSVSFYLSIKCIDFDHTFFLHSNCTSYCFQEFMGDEQGHVKGIKTVQIKWVQVRFILNQPLKLIRRCLETGAQGACKHAPHLLLTASIDIFGTDSCF